MTTESKRSELNWDSRLREVASSFQYPDTPDIQPAVQKRLGADNAHGPLVRSVQRNEEWRRLALAALVALLALVMLLAVPTVRAAIARFLHIGAITISVSETEAELRRSPEPPGGPVVGSGEHVTRTSAPTVLPTIQAASTSEPGLVTVLTPAAVPDMSLSTPIRLPTPTPSATPAAVLEGPFTLLQAEEIAGFTIRLPGPSTGLGPPDEIYLQRPGRIDSLMVAIVVWLRPQGLETPELALYQIGVPDYGIKAASRESLTESEVNGERAYWIEGEHLLQIPHNNGDVETRLVGNVLVWTTGELTYRLEGAPSIDDAVFIAESLEPDVEN